MRGVSVLTKFNIYLFASLACIIIPIIGLLYGIWDSHQPNTEPIGDGDVSLGLFQWILIISSLCIGIINLPIAIIRYKRHKGIQSQSESSRLNYYERTELLS
jgi:TRAP-type C4-dicarboxylate transport system permease small subunit